MTHEALHEKLEELRASRPLLRVDTLWFPVDVIDIREAWGRVDVRVRPETFPPDSESMWVSLDRIHYRKEK